MRAAAKVRIGKPTKETPTRPYGRWTAVLAAAFKLGRGEWLPVECENREDRRRLQAALLAPRGWRKKQKLTTHKGKGTMLYIAKVSR